MSRIRELEDMLGNNPDDPFLIYALAREYESSHFTMQALLLYETLINEHPDYIATYYHYAKLLHNAGNRNEGIRMIQRGIEKGTLARDSHAVSELKALLLLWADSDDD